MPASTKPPVPFKKILAECEHEELIYCIEGTITALYEAKKGQSDRGPWEFQNGKIKDAEGTEMKICFASNTQPMSAKGKKVTIRAFQTDAHGWNGVKYDVSSWSKDGKEGIDKAIKVTATAEVVYDSGAPASSGKNETAGQSTLVNQSVGHPKPFLLDAAALHKACFGVAGLTYGEVAPPDFLQAATATLFIEAARNGYIHGFRERMSKPEPVAIPPAPSDPTQWKTCVIPNGKYQGKTLEEVSDEDITKFYDGMAGKETALAKCVNQAFADRGLLKKRQDEEAALKGDDDGIPY